MTEEQLVEEAQAALARSHLERVIVPIYLMHDSDAVEARGTGTLLEVGDKLCLITAAHVFDGCDRTRLASPWGRKQARIVTWGEMRLRKAPEGSKLPDVAIAELRSPDTIAAFRANYHCLALDRVAMPTLGLKNHHVLAGFPAEMTRVSGMMIDQDPLFYFTTILGEPPPDSDLKEEWQPGFDLFFALERRVRVLGPKGEMAEMPSLKGASGCVIWEMSREKGLWTPDKALIAVGVQRSEMRGKWFRATNWLAVIPLLAPIDERAAHQLAVALIGDDRAAALFRAAGYEAFA